MSERYKEEQVRQLIYAVCKKYPRGAQKWRRAMNQLLREIEALEGLEKSFHVDYGEVLGDALLEVSQRICEFRPTRSSLLTRNLVSWINYKLRLKYRVLDLGRSDVAFKSRILEAQIIGKEGSLKNLVEDLQDPRPSNLWELEAETEECERQKTVREIGTKLINYIEQDKEGKLRSCYPRNYPECNCKIIIQRLYLKQPPDKLPQLARDFGIPYQTLIAHWKRKVQPLMQQISLEIGYCHSTPLRSDEY